MLPGDRRGDSGFRLDEIEGKVFRIVGSEPIDLGGERIGDRTRMGNKDKHDSLLPLQDEGGMWEAIGIAEFVVFVLGAGDREHGGKSEKWNDEAKMVTDRFHDESAPRNSTRALRIIPENYWKVSRLSTPR